MLTALHSLFSYIAPYSQDRPVFRLPFLRKCHAWLSAHDVPRGTVDPEYMVGREVPCIKPVWSKGDSQSNPCYWGPPHWKEWSLQNVSYMHICQMHICCSARGWGRQKVLQHCWNKGPGSSSGCSVWQFGVEGASQGSVGSAITGSLSFLALLFLL